MVLECSGFKFFCNESFLVLFSEIEFVFSSFAAVPPAGGGGGYLIMRNLILMFASLWVRIHCYTCRDL